MIVPTKYVCDICGKEIEYYSGITSSWGRFRHHYVIKMTTYEDEGWNLEVKPQKTKVDVCTDCYKKMSEWIRKEKANDNSRDG